MAPTLFPSAAPFELSLAPTTVAPTFAPTTLAPTPRPSFLPTPRPTDARPLLGTYDSAVIVAGLCTIVSIAMSLHLIRSHLRNYVKPQRQRYVIRILWMVPIYAVDSFLSLCFIRVAILFEVPRDVYESYVIYNFVALLIDYMGGEDAAQAFFAAQPPQKHWWPFGWMGDHDMSVFLATCRLCTLQYSIVRPLTAVCTLFLYVSGDYDDADLRFSGSYLWLMLLNNSSVTLALYYLIYFYHASLPCAPLQRGRPLAKFLAVKAVVFFCFWQYCAISILVALGVIRRQLSHRSADATTTGMNDFVVCVEMAVFSVVHLGVFGWREHATDCVRGATFNPMAALGASPARSSAAWDADGGGDDQALSYDQAYRDMFFIGDVTADLGRVVREAPRVLFRGCGRVNHARKERARERAERRSKSPDHAAAPALELATLDDRPRTPPPASLDPRRARPGDLAAPEPRRPLETPPRPSPLERRVDDDDPNAAWWSSV